MSEVTDFLCRLSLVFLKAQRKLAVSFPPMGSFLRGCRFRSCKRTSATCGKKGILSTSQNKQEQDTKKHCSRTYEVWHTSPRIQLFHHNYPPGIGRDHCPSKSRMDCYPSRFETGVDWLSTDTCLTNHPHVAAMSKYPVGSVGL